MRKTTPCTNRRYRHPICSTVGIAILTATTPHKGRVNKPAIRHRTRYRGSRYEGLRQRTGNFDLNVGSDDPTQGLRILVLEDDPADEFLIRRALTRSFPSVEIDVRVSLREAIDGIGEFHPTLIISDLELPDATRTDAIEAFAESAALTPVIAMTSTDIGSDCIAAGAQDFVDKREFAAKSFERTIRHTMARWQNIERLHYLSAHEQLTGLSNRWTVEKSAPRLITSARRMGYHIAVILADLDHFKQIKDNFGHSAGDQVLAQAAAEFKSCFRPKDLAARWGGDEFLSLIAIPGRADLDHLHDRLQQLELSPVRITERPGAQVQPTLTIGRAQSGPESGDGLAELVAQADRALYAVKSRRPIGTAPSTN